MVTPGLACGARAQAASACAPRAFPDTCFPGHHAVSIAPTRCASAHHPSGMCRYVAKTLKPPMEVFHGMPGTAYKFRQPGSHREMQNIEVIKGIIERRYLPILKRKSVKYQLHMYAENVDATSGRIGEIILRAANEDIKPDILLLTTNNKVRCGRGGRCGWLLAWGLGGGERGERGEERGEAHKSFGLGGALHGAGMAVCDVVSAMRRAC